jgi:hypothetical protein
MADIRNTIKQSINTLKGPAEQPQDPDQDGDNDAPVGLAQNAEGVPFQCGTCEYFDQGVCHNDNPKLNGREVQPEWCCNLYDHDGMQHVVD